MISVLLPVFNRESTIKKTLQSLFEQTYDDWEAVIVDDGSTDNTVAVLQQAQRENPGKIVILRNDENIGLTRSLVRAAAAAKGEYFARVDAGDYFHREKLGLQADFLDSHQEYGIVGCAYRNIFFPSGRTVDVRVPTSDRGIRSRIMKKNPFAHSCVLLRASTYRQAGGYDEHVRYGQDYDLWFRMLSVAKAANLPEILCVRTMSADSISFQRQREQMWQTIKTKWRYMKKWKFYQFLYFLEPLAFILIPKPLEKRFRSRANLR